MIKSEKKNYYFILRLLLKILIISLCAPIVYVLPIKKKYKGRYLKFALENFGISFIKFGQALGTRADIISEDVIKEISGLQDRVKPLKFSVIKKIIEKTYSDKIDNIFLEVEESPIGSASVAQVHKGILKNKQIVAIKILRPNIEQKIMIEIKFLVIICRIIEVFSFKLKQMKIVDLIKEVKENLKKELDLRLEAAAMKNIKNLFKNDKLYNEKILKIPIVYSVFLQKNILVLEFIDGLKLQDIMNGNENENKNIIARNLILIFFKQVYEYGYYHADLHPGNILVSSNGGISLLDFGINFKLSLKQRKYITNILYGYLNKDYEYVAKSHIEAGLIDADHNLSNMVADFEALGEKIVGRPVAEISIGIILRDIFNISNKYAIKIDIELLFLQKNIIMLEGIAYQLDKTINIWAVVGPHVKNWYYNNLNLKEKFIIFYRKLEKKFELVAACLNLK